VNVLQRIWRFWKPAPNPDHPLTEEERHEHHAVSAWDEVGRAEEQFVGDDFDPDEPRAGKD
jgi:hypothetical protein